MKTRRFSVQPEMPLTVIERFQTAMDLHEVGAELVRQRLRRERPNLAESEVEESVSAWLATRPGAEHGDGVGVPIGWPRTRR